MSTKLCVLFFLLSMASGTTGTFLTDDSITFGTGVAGATGQDIIITFTYDTAIGTGAAIEIALPNFSGADPLIGSSTSCGGTTNDAVADSGSAGTYKITYTTDSSTGVAARAVCKIVVEDLTLPTTIAASDDGTAYTINIASAGALAVSTVQPVTGIALAANHDSISFSTQSVSTAVTITYSFVYNKVFALDDKIELTLPYFSGTPASTSWCDGGTTSFDSGAVSNEGLVNNKVTLDVASATLTANTACTIVITGLTTPGAANSFVENSRTLKSSYNLVASNEGTTLVPITSSNSVGVPTLYSIKSECRTGGVSSGGLANCDSITSCLACTGTEGFVEVYGTSCTTGTQIRCDARISAQTSVDIYFNPNGVAGTVACGAFVEGAIPDVSTLPVAPTAHISGLTTGSSLNDLYSRNSVVVTSAGTASDHVVTLNRLDTDSMYHVYCHNDDFKLSAYLDVHTLANTFLSMISLAADVLTGAQSPVQLTLTLTHGKALASSNTITMTTTPHKIFTTSSTDASCSATSAGVSLVVQSATGQDDTLTVTLGGASSAGNEIVITCTGSLSSNYATGAVVRIASLAVTNHETAYGLVGYTTT